MKVKNILIINLILFLFSNLGYSQPTRAQIITNAQDYLFFTWTPNTNCVEQFETAERPSNSSEPKRKNDFYDIAYQGNAETGMCFGWGCWNTTSDFSNKIVLGTAANTEALDSGSDSGTSPMSYDIMMGSRNQYSINLNNTGSNTILMTLTEKFSGQQLVNNTIVNAGQTGSITGPSGNGYSQTLILKVDPFFSGDPISWNTTGQWGRPAEQTRFSSGAHSVHAPSGASSWAAGIDCSGLVSRSWELSTKQSTTTLNTNYELISIEEQLAKGDILVKPGVHVVIVKDISLPLISYIHACGPRGTEEVLNVNLQNQFLNQGYNMRSLFFQPLGINQDITTHTTWDEAVDVYGYDGTGIYTGEKEIHVRSPYTLTLESNACVLIKASVNFVVDAGATLIIRNGAECIFEQDGEIIIEGEVIDESGQCEWSQGACILALNGGIYRNTSSNPLIIDNGAFLAIQGGTFELPNAGTVFKSGSYWDIGPGSTIKVQPNQSITVEAGAYIDAVGTAASPITFTSLDGTPSRSEWGTVYINSSNNTFEYCTIEGSDWGLKFYGTPSTTSGNVVKNCTFKKTTRPSAQKIPS